MAWPQWIRCFPLLLLAAACLEGVTGGDAAEVCGDGLPDWAQASETFRNGSATYALKYGGVSTLPHVSSQEQPLPLLDDLIDNSAYGKRSGSRRAASALRFGCDGSFELQVRIDLDESDNTAFRDLASYRVLKLNFNRQGTWAVVGQTIELASEGHETLVVRQLEEPVVGGDYRFLKIEGLDEVATQSWQRQLYDMVGNELGFADLDPDLGEVEDFVFYLYNYD